MGTFENKKNWHKIRRQHIKGGFITDFVCLMKNLIIEIEGEIHNNQKDYDINRTKILNELGFDVIRFTNKEVFKNSILVVNIIKSELDLRV